MVKDDTMINVQIKTLRDLEWGHYIIAITRGPVDIEGFSYIFDRLVEETKLLLECKILIDLQDSTFRFLPSEVTKFVETIDPQAWPHNNRVALVFSPATGPYQQLVMLAESLIKRNLRFTVFYDTKEAIGWLSDTD